MPRNHLRIDARAVLTTLMAVPKLQCQHLASPDATRIPKHPNLTALRWPSFACQVCKSCGSSDVSKAIESDLKRAFDEAIIEVIRHCTKSNSFLHFGDTNGRFGMPHPCGIAKNLPGHHPSLPVARSPREANHRIPHAT